MNAWKDCAVTPSISVLVVYELEVGIESLHKWQSVRS